MLWSLLRDALGLVPQLLQHSTPVGKAFSIQAFYSPLSWAWLSLSKVDDPPPQPAAPFDSLPLTTKSHLSRKSLSSCHFKHGTHYLTSLRSQLVISVKRQKSVSGSV